MLSERLTRDSERPRAFLRWMSLDRRGQNVRPPARPWLELCAPVPRGLVSERGRERILRAMEDRLPAKITWPAACVAVHPLIVSE